MYNTTMINEIYHLINKENSVIMSYTTNTYTIIHLVENDLDLLKEIEYKLEEKLQEFSSIKRSITVSDSEDLVYDLTSIRFPDMAERYGRDTCSGYVNELQYKDYLVKIICATFKNEQDKETYILTIIIY